MNRDDLSTYLRRVPGRVVEGVLAHPDRIRKVLFPSSTETVIDDEVLITVTGLGYIDYELAPSARISELGAPIGDVDLGGGGPARAFTSADVRKLATQLTLHPITGLAQALSNTPLPPQAPSIKELLETFKTIQAFVLETAQAEAAMIVYWG